MHSHCIKKATIAACSTSAARTSKFNYLKHMEQSFFECQMSNVVY